MQQAAIAARRVIVRNGLAETTLRDIAAEAGFTTGVLAHYFEDKRAVIFGAFKAAYADWASELRRALADAQSPKDELRRFLDHAAPRDEAGQAEWRLWVEMWVYAGSDPAFAGELLAADADLQAEINSFLQRMQRAGLIRLDVDTDVHSRVINRLFDGVCVRAWLGGHWEQARHDIVAHMALLGLPGDVVVNLLEPAGATSRDRV